MRWGSGLLLGLATLCTAVPGCSRAPATPPVSRVVLLGIDGLDWSLLEPAMRAGRTPNLRRLRDAGASGPLETLLPTYSPIIWASIATGKSAEKHGIDFFGRRGAHNRVFTPYTSNSRRVKAVWNILSERDRQVAVAGWWNTWPAESVRGTLVSDRMLYTRFNLWFQIGAFGEGLPRQTWPPELFDEIAPLAKTEPESWQTFTARFLPHETQKSPHRQLHDPAFELYLAWLRDRSYDAIARAIHDPETAFEAYYWNGVDIASHYFLKFRRPDEWPEPLPPEQIARYGSVIDDYLAWVDERIGWITEQAGPDTVVMVVSDHGFRLGRRGDSPAISGIHFDSAPPGVVILAGGSIPKGHRIEKAHVYDVAPTVLYLLGLPAARDMDGRVLDVARSAADGHGTRPIEWIDTYEDGSRRVDPTPIPTETDAAILQRLEALGYMDPGGVPPPAPDTDAGP